MVTTYNGKDMVQFGKYFLSKKRTELITSNYQKGDSISLEERLQEVYHADFENWKESKKKEKTGVNNEMVFGFVEWLQDNCELSEDKTIWSYDSEDYTNERLFEIYKSESLISQAPENKKEELKNVVDYLWDFDNLSDCGFFGSKQKIGGYSLNHKEMNLKEFLSKGREFIRLHAVSLKQ